MVRYVVMGALVLGCVGPTEDPMGEPPGDPQVQLGELPAELTIHWPERPRIEREVEVANAAAFEEAASVPGTRIVVTASFGGTVAISADDVEVVADGVSLGRLLIERTRSRIRVLGGRWETIELAVPASFYPGPPEWRAEWLVSDVMIDGVEVEAADTGFLVRGRRVAIVRSRAHAVRYAVWCGETDDFQSEDVILAGNDFASDGPEATVRLVSVLRSVTVDNRLSNGLKHNYRVHGHSDLNYAARNTLITTGVMLGRLPGDDLGRVWLDDNILHHQSPSLLLVDPTTDRFISRGNTIYTDTVGCWLCDQPQDGWTVEDNAMLPFRAP